PRLQQFAFILDCLDEAFGARLRQRLPPGIVDALKALHTLRASDWRPARLLLDLDRGPGPVRRRRCSLASGQDQCSKQNGDSRLHENSLTVICQSFDWRNKFNMPFTRRTVVL